MAEHLIYVGKKTILKKLTLGILIFNYIMFHWFRESSFKSGWGNKINCIKEFLFYFYLQNKLNILLAIN